MRVALDTNVLVAGLRSNQGASFRLLQQVPLRRFHPQISVPLFLEYEAVLKRPDIGIGLAPAEIDAILDIIAAFSNPVWLHYLWRPVLPDPADDMVLELAVASNAKAIVTFNIKDFSEVARFGVQVLTPRDFRLRLQETTG
ncbi:MAG: putative toxin-antitoxin system toxin component, PIN family [Magnetococcales bacterium]|nr:putative toxin-antitoxin system toxin component, PIN family [Magnetococcales bacterium]